MLIIFMSQQSTMSSTVTSEASIMVTPPEI